MASALVTTSNLARFRSLIEGWEAKQPPVKEFSTPLDAILSSSSPDAFNTPEDANNASLITGRDSKEVLVAFRTRPPLPGEAEEKFKAMEEFVYRGGGRKVEKEDLEVAFCPGLTVRSADPGVVVAHVPYMKVSEPFAAPHEID